MSQDEEDSYNITLCQGISITAIDRQRKTVTDSQGKKHPLRYTDHGHRKQAAQLKDVRPLCIFTMRSRPDADAFESTSARRTGKVVIAGGGLLGIELAPSLREMGIPVSVIQHTSG